MRLAKSLKLDTLSPFFYYELLMILMNIIYKEFTEMTISEQTFSQKNAESNILLVTYYFFRKVTRYIT